MHSSDATILLLLLITCITLTEAGAQTSTHTYTNIYACTHAFLYCSRSDLNVKFQTYLICVILTFGTWRWQAYCQNVVKTNKIQKLLKHFIVKIFLIGPGKSWGCVTGNVSRYYTPSDVGVEIMSHWQILFHDGELLFL